MITKEEYEQAQKVIKQYESEQLGLLRVSNSAHPVKFEWSLLKITWKDVFN